MIQKIPAQAGIFFTFLYLNLPYAKDCIPGFDFDLLHKPPIFANYSKKSTYEPAFKLGNPGKQL
jgi:hypothetical protein